MKVLAIDYGTSNTCMCTMDSAGQPVPIKFSDGEYLLPSVVYFGPDNEIIIGKEAKHLRAAYPDDVVCEGKRQAGKTDADGRPAIRHVDRTGKNWTGEEVTGLILAKCKKDAEAISGSEFDTVLVTVPACFNQAQRQFVINAAKIAGFRRTFTVDEPTAASFAYGLTKSPGAYTVVDIGGGTTDITVVRVDGQANVTAISTGGRPDLGGIDADLIVIARIMKEAESAGVEKSVLDDPSVRQDIKDRSETLKHSLSVRTESQFNMFVGGKRVSFTYTREEFERDCKPLMDQVIAILDETLKKASLAPQDITDTVLVGGATRMPMVAARLALYLHKDARRDTDQDLSVVRGGAITLAKMLQDAGEKLLSYKDDKPVRRLPGGKITNCAAHDLGCSAYNAAGTHQEFTPIIRKGTLLPAKESQIFAMKDSGQTAVTVSIYQGEDGKPLSECCHIDDVNLTGLPVADLHMLRIVVEYSYTPGGLCEVLVRDTVSGKIATAKISHILGMNEQDVEAGEQAVKQAKIQ